MSAFLLIMLSALFHAGWNILVKVADDKLSYTVHIHVAAAIFFTGVMVAFYPEALIFDKTLIMYAIASPFFFAIYQLLVAAAYKYADVSMIYPITTSSPLFIIIWAYLFLGEKITIIGFIGILMIISGCFIMNKTKGTNKLAFNGILLALGAALVYSFGAVVDKLSVNGGNPMLYIYLMILFSAFFTSIMVGIIHINVKHKPVQWRLVIAGGLIIACSTVFYRLGLIEMQAAYATALRQVSAFFGLAMGLIFFKESYGVTRFIGCLVIFSGIILIRLGM